MEVRVRVEVFTAVTMKNVFFYNVSPCGTWKNSRFDETIASIIRVLQFLVPANIVPTSLILFALMMEATFIRNIGSYKSHAASHHRRHNSSAWKYRL
jgi:hypothetical protein